ncbi:MAG: hypothetical protein SFU91_10220 [Chloroherpetonaceae bacterium]|nr:hypothetical protein [Chloroherpetonaceae bacterium]
MTVFISFLPIKKFPIFFIIAFFAIQLTASDRLFFVKDRIKERLISSSLHPKSLQTVSSHSIEDSSKAISITELINSGDDKFEAMEYPSAISIYEKALSIEPTNPEILWRLARVFVCTGDVTEEKDREVYYIKATEYARQSVTQQNISSKCYTWLSAALGNLAMYRGSRDKVKFSVEIKQYVEKAIQLNPNDDVAYSILGSFHRALGNVSWLERQLANVFLGGLPEGGYIEAENAYNKAIKISPSGLRHHFELGLLYLDWGKDQEAYSVFLKASQLKPQMLSDIDRLNRIKEYLKSLKP